MTLTPRPETQYEEPRRLIAEACRTCPIPHTIYYDEGEPERQQCLKCHLTILRGHYWCQRPLRWENDGIVTDLSEMWGRYSSAEQMQRPDRCCHELYRQVFDLENQVRGRLGLPQRQWPTSGMEPPPADGLSRQQRLYAKKTQEAKAKNQDPGPSDERANDDAGPVSSLGEAVDTARGGNWLTRLWNGGR